MPEVLTPSAVFRDYARSLLDLHLLRRQGEEDSEEADAITDGLDDLVLSMTEPERQRAEGLSDDLDALADPPAGRPMSAAERRLLTEAVEASAAGDHDRALTLLRVLRGAAMPEVLSALRGPIWLALGEPATAAFFLDHAARC